MSWPEPKVLGIIIVAVIVVAIAAVLFIRVGRKLTPSVLTWKTYLGGQGILLFVFLLLGAVIAYVFSQFGPYTGEASNDGQASEFKNLNPSQNVIYEEVNVENYSHITVLARTMAPENGSATVVFYGDPKGGSAQEINRIQSVTGSWSRWEQKNSNKHLTLKIMSGGNLPAATDMSVLVYLFPK
jgi:hypothetical protein